MKVTLILISFLRPVFFTDEVHVADGRWQCKEISVVFCILDSLLSLTKFPPIITQYIKRNISVSCKNGDNPSDNG